MRRFETLTGVAIPLATQNADTDIILSAEHLKVVTRTGLDCHAFAKLRIEPGSVFDDPRNIGAPILIAGDNFGCGSSREHAAWAIAGMGIRAILAPSFADIFASNAFKNGILLVELPRAQIERLLAVAQEAEITVDLEHQVVTTPDQDRLVTLRPWIAAAAHGCRPTTAEEEIA